MTDILFNIQSCINFLFRKKTTSDNQEESFFWEKLASFEGNTFILADKKDSLERFYDNLFSSHVNGTIFHDINRSFDVNEIFQKEIYDTECLEKFLLKQKTLIDEAHVPPYVIIFDRCNIHSDKIYQECIENSKQMCLRTITIASKATDIPEKLLEKFDTILMFKDRNKIQLDKNVQILWEKIYKKKITLPEFQQVIKENADKRKGKAIFATESGISSVKFAKGKPALFTIVQEFDR